MLQVLLIYSLNIFLFHSCVLHSQVG